MAKPDSEQVERARRIVTAVERDTTVMRGAWYGSDEIDLNRVMTQRVGGRETIPGETEPPYYETAGGERIEPKDYEWAKNVLEAGKEPANKSVQKGEDSKQPSEQQTDLANIRFLAESLFEMDPEKALRVDHLMTLPAVRRYMEKWNTQVRSMRSTLNTVAPGYATRKRGRPKNAGDWEAEDTGEYLLQLPYEEKSENSK